MEMFPPLKRAPAAGEQVPGAPAGAAAGEQAPSVAAAAAAAGEVQAPGVAAAAAAAVGGRVVEEEATGPMTAGSAKREAVEGVEALARAASLERNSPESTSLMSD